MSKKICAVAMCNNTSFEDKSLSWHRFPKSDAELRNEWIRRCRRADPINLNHSRICSAHFATEDFERNFKKELMGTPGRRYLKQNAIPTLHLKPDQCAKKAALPQNRKRKSSSANYEKGDTTASRNSKVIAKSKRTRQVDDRSYMTEEIVFEVEEPPDDNNHDDEDDYQSKGNETVGRRKPEKGVFEFSVDLIDDEDDLSSPTTIPIDSKLHDPTAGCSKIVNHTVEKRSTLSRVSSDQGETLKHERTPPKMEYDAYQEASSQKSPTECKPALVDDTECDNSVECVHRLAKAAVSLPQTKKPQTIKRLSDPQKPSLEKIFTPNQLTFLMKTKKSVRWTDDEIFEAIKLRFFSLSMYSYLRKEKGYPFPGRLAINHWAKKMKLRGGILLNVLKIIELGGKYVSANEKDETNENLCVLSLSEMKVQETIEYDETDDEINGPFGKMNVMMASSLSGYWRQPVFVDFDSNITKDTVMIVIDELYKVGYYVVCFTSDCSDASVNLWNDLGASMDKPCFPHPTKDGPVMVVPDSLHAIRLVRDNLLDGGFQIEGSIVNREPLDALLELGVCSKLKTSHLRQSKETFCTDLAAQLISRTVGTALVHHKPGDAGVATSTGNFLRVMDHWFDLMNVGSSEQNVPFRSPYGCARPEQDKLLNHVKSLISCMKCGGSRALKSFQIGIIMSCNGISLLLDEMKHFRVEHIMTKWVNHSSINDLFSTLTSKYSEVPKPAVALDRLRLNLFRHKVDSPEENFVFTYVIGRAKINATGNTGQMDIFKSITPDLLDIIFSSSEYITDNNLSHYSLNLIAEKINSGLRHKYPQLCKCGNLSGIKDSYGGHEPTAFFLGNLVKMENFFDIFTRGRFLSECKNIILRLTRTMKGFPSPLPIEVIKIFVRLRIEIYVRSLVPKIPQLVIKRQMQSKLLNALRSDVN